MTRSELIEANRRAIADAERIIADMQLRITPTAQPWRVNFYNRQIDYWRGVIEHRRETLRRLDADSGAESVST